jgi:nicotinate-nucleotide adenylyltransferase
MPLEGALLPVYYFGSFNPVHQGHMAVALACHQHTQRSVVFVPSANPPNKLNETLLPIALRRACLEAAIEHHPQLREVTSVSMVEQACYERTQSPSYTLETLRVLHPNLEQLPSHSLCVLLGEDTFASLPSWYQVQQLVKACTFYIYPRAGLSPAGAGAVSAASWQQATARVQAAMGEAVCCHWLSHVPLQDGSSTQLRQVLLTLKQANAKALDPSSDTFLQTWLPPGVLPLLPALLQQL